jgi:5-methylcytosine-specific restriction endonuclease McrA
MNPSVTVITWGVTGMESDVEQSKACSVCKQILPYEAFGKIAKSKTGRRSQCNNCRKLESRSYRQRYPDKKREADRLYYLTNTEKVKANVRKYVIENSEFVSQYRKAYRERNAERIAEGKRDWRKRNSDWADNASKRWQENNRELVRKYHQEGRKRNPDRDKNYYLANRHRYRAASARRRRVIANQPKFKITAKDFEKIMHQPCIYCGGKAEHLDHVIPIARGGLHKIGNLAPACAKCNLSKSAKFVTEWRYR